MLQNYLFTLLRNVRKRRFYALLNVGGLSLGLTVCLLITLYVRNEFRYDAHHEKAGRVVLLQQFEGGSTSGAAFAPALKAGLSGVEDAARLAPVTALLTLGPVSYYEPRFYFADSSVFNVLTVPLVAGNPAHALSVPYGLVLSEKMARKYFGRQNPVGKVLQFGDGQPLYVTGVMRDWPDNGHVAADFLCNFRSAEGLLGKSADVTTYWGGSSLTYLLLTPGTRPADVQAQLPGFAKRTGDPNAAVWKLNLLPLRDIYLRYQLDGRVKAQNAMQYVYLFSAVAAFILVLACFNYINLASARAATRAKEVGVRKSLGASRSQLVRQFLAESAVFTGLAFGLAVGLAYLSLPAFNQLAGVQLSLDGLVSPGVAAAVVGGLLGLTLVTGGYPALVLSAFRPVAVLKNLLPRGAGNASFRQVLVVVQFSVSVTMIVATLVVLSQLDYIRHKDLGYRQEQVLNASGRPWRAWLPYRPPRCRAACPAPAPWARKNWSKNWCRPANRPGACSTSTPTPTFCAPSALNSWPAATSIRTGLPTPRLFSSTGRPWIFCTGKPSRAKPSATTPGSTPPTAATRPCPAAAR
jgi:putative ABC transport system permease protein